MNQPVEATVQQDAIKLKKTDKEVVKNIVEGKMDEVIETLTAFMSIKKKIKKDLMECSIAHIPNSESRDILKKIQQNELFQADKILQSIEDTTGEPINYEDLEEDDIDELKDILYVWFGPDEYVRDLYQIGTLIAGLSVPDFLKTYVSEARQCYAFQQYNAVYSLCRTIIESAVRHRCQRKGIIRHQEKMSDMINYKPSELINKSTKGALRERVKEIYTDTSALLHGRKTVTQHDAITMFKDTLKVVQEMENY